MHRTVNPIEPRPALRTAAALIVLAAVALTLFATARPAVALGNSVTSTTVVEGDSGTANASVTAEWSVRSLTLITITVAPVAPATSADVTPSTISFYDLGSGSRTVSVPVIGDLIREPSQQATVTLHIGGASGSTFQGTVTIIDNDHPTATIADRNMLESGSVDNANVFTINLSKAIADPTQLRVQSFGGTATAGVDYQSLSTVVTVPAFATSTTVTVTIINDAIIELNNLETFNLIVSPVTAGDLAVGGDLVATGHISDDDQNALTASAIFQLGSDPVAGPGLVGSCRSDLPIGEPFINPVDVTFRLTLSRASPLAFEFNLFTDTSSAGTNASAGSDFQPIDRVQVFPANTRTMTFTVRIFDDGVSEGDEFFSLRATDGLIANTQPCPQNLLGGDQDVKIGANIF